MRYVPLLPLVVAAYFDLRARTIPDSIPALLLAWSATLVALDAGPGLAAALLGLAVGGILGVTGFACGAFGGGDAKLIASLGACLGPTDLGATLVYGAVIGGVLALVAIRHGEREFAYGPAIAAGFAVSLIVPDGVLLARAAS